MSLVFYVLLCSFRLILICGQNLSYCESFPQKGEFVVQCNERNYTNFPLASTLPENTSFINFKDNKVQQLPNQPRGVLRVKLWNIDLSGNIIDQLLEDKLGKAFPHVSHLDLSSNKIRILSQYSFQYLSKLNVLHLSHNNIESIDQNSFTHLSLLSWLDLRHNR